MSDMEERLDKGFDAFLILLIISIISSLFYFWHETIGVLSMWILKGIGIILGVAFTLLTIIYILGYLRQKIGV